LAKCNPLLLPGVFASDDPIELPIVGRVKDSSMMDGI
jgi:hypothetical protein